VIYRRRSSPLHAARAGVASLWCVVVAALALALEHPVLLLALLGAVLAAAAAARVARDVLRVTAWTLPFALLIAAINPVVTRDGLTVILRAGEWPVLGRLDVTLEATIYGGVLGLRALVVIACFALHSAAVDPDQLLRAFRRLGLRSALTATLATRMVGVLARDARRMRDAQLSRGGPPVRRAAVLRSITVNALDRAVDVAATLEVRGYGSARRSAVRRRRPWSRHDAAFAASAAGLAAAAAGALALGWDPFEAYPQTIVPVDAGVGMLALALGSFVLLPFADRRGAGA
jgi:energy-coupling factor transport system permease protein